MLVPSLAKLEIHAANRGAGGAFGSFTMPVFFLAFMVGSIYTATLFFHPPTLFLEMVKQL